MTTTNRITLFDADQFLHFILVLLDVFLDGLDRVGIRPNTVGLEQCDVAFVQGLDRFLLLFIVIKLVLRLTLARRHVEWQISLQTRHQSLWSN